MSSTSLWGTRSSSRHVLVSSATFIYSTRRRRPRCQQ
jgi:hypothetical protein